MQLLILAIQPLVCSCCWTVTWGSRLYILLGLPQVVTTGYVFGQVGGNDGHQGVLHKQLRCGGTPAPRGRYSSPNNVPEKKKENVCVLGMGCGHLASPSGMNLGPVWARGSASRGRVLAIPSLAEKKGGGIPLFDCFRNTNECLRVRYIQQVFPAQYE